MEPQKLSKALDNVQNNIFLKLSSDKIKKQQIKIFKDLKMSQTIIQSYLSKLEGYRYVDEINQIKRGSYIRWVDLNDSPNFVLQRGGSICDVLITDTSTLIKCRNNYGNSFFHVRMDECIIFQKLTTEEKLILSAMDYLNE